MTLEMTVYGADRGELSQRAREMAQQFYGDVSYRMSLTRAWPHHETLDGRVLVWCAEYDAHAVTVPNTPPPPPPNPRPNTGHPIDDNSGDYGPDLFGFLRRSKQ